MPFRNSQYHGTFTPEDLQVLQAAYNHCCVLLNRSPAADEDKEKLARTIIRVFQSGEHVPEKIAQIVASSEFLRN
ncbi:hypothetical protein KUG47_06980 [Falsochrobactrum sp. TDYN1]|uniref:Uncharacterized protein n=1 Tax=Falsochrobactrum tianjinense TaxID=2706015 RepID=A0A949PM84_9HYPH|nr:hypothetical protein [Falsochrobactrum sp. TDYN1]MBV2143238.1 hypothetical protein [Falsochrobactrum sp. TDYN1]